MVSVRPVRVYRYFQVALKPILHSWLEKAEEAMKQKDTCGDISGILPNTDKKRKGASMAAPGKRLLEDYFRYPPVQDGCNTCPTFPDSSRGLRVRGLPRLPRN